MTNIDDFKGEARDKIDGLIDETFPDALPELEIFFGGRTGGLTRNQILWFEGYWNEHGPSTSARAVWDALKHTNEREKFAKRRPTVRREVVRIFGHKVVRYRDVRTGRWVRRRGRI